MGEPAIWLIVYVAGMVVVGAVCHDKEIDGDLVWTALSWPLWVPLFLPVRLGHRLGRWLRRQEG
jgi:hypothetical protein